MRRWLLGLVLAASMAFTGCFGGDGGDRPPEAAAPVPVDPAFDGVGANATGGLGLAETNQTSGRAHIHDYWADRTEVTLADVILTNDASPFPGGSLGVNDGVFRTYYQFPYGTIVYEGTGRLSFAVSELDATISGLRFRYLTPSASEWSEFVPLSPDVPLEIAVTPQLTDMPHATASGWSFEFYGDGLHRVDLGSFRFIAKAFKGNQVEKWPAHPDFYAGKSYRVVLDTDASTTVRGVADSVAYDRGIAYVRPEKLVSMGTARLVVFMNVTRTDSPPGTDAVGYILEYRNASHPEPSIRRVDPNENSSSAKESVFDIAVDVGGHDAPYAEQSRWGFRPRALFASNGGFSLCPGCFEYTVHYHITVIAFPFESPMISEDPVKS